MLASRSEARVPFELARLTRVLAIVVVGAAVMLLLQESAGEAFSPLGLLVRGGTLVVLLAAMWLGVLRRDERLTIRDYVAARLGRANGSSP
jgi:hypothetical protein